MNIKNRHHGKEELAEISYPSRSRRIMRWPKMIESGKRLKIMEKLKRIRTEEEMEAIEMRRNRSRRGDYEIQASPLRQSGMRTKKRTFRIGRGARRASGVERREVRA